MTQSDADQLIDFYQLAQHIEGGFFREDFKSDVVLPGGVLGKEGPRSLITTCYYLLKRGDRSIFHRLASDEMWIFLKGGPVDFFEIDPCGRLHTSQLGPEVRLGQQLKHLVKKGHWFGVLPQASTEYAFFSAIVFPGFEYVDWEKGEKQHLKTLCSEAHTIIDRLT
jgi:predicted cupin superfamily sugar epimerase